MSKVKVLHVIARMNLGGTANYINKLVENNPNSYLATGHVQKFEIEVPNIENLGVYRVKDLGRKISPINDFKSWIELRKIIKKLKPQIIHTHTFKAGLIGRLIPGKYKRVHTFHGQLFDDPSFSCFTKKLIFLIEKLLAYRTDFFISVGQKVGNELRSKGIGRQKTWASVPPGVCQLTRYEKLEARYKLNLPKNGLIVGWLARVTQVKNPKLISEIARNFPEFTFAIGGNGDEYDSIKASAPSNLILLGWVDPAYFWSAVDIAISTSHNEGMPISIIEAQLYGIPAISFDVGSTSEVIENGATGYIVKGDLIEFQAKLERILNSEDLRQKFGKNAKEVSERKFNVPLLIKTHDNIYKNLI